MCVYQNQVIIESLYKALSVPAKERNEPASGWDLEIWLQLFLTLALQTGMNKLYWKKKKKTKESTSEICDSNILLKKNSRKLSSFAEFVPCLW